MNVFTAVTWWTQKIQRIFSQYDSDLTSSFKDNRGNRQCDEVNFKIKKNKIPFMIQPKHKLLSELHALSL